MTRFVQDTVSAICYEIVRRHDLLQEAGAPLAEVERFVFGQLERMPKLMGAAVIVATATFGASAWFHGLRVFHRQTADRRALHWMRWKSSALGPCRDLVRLYESLVTLLIYAAAGWEAMEGTHS